MAGVEEGAGQRAIEIEGFIHQFHVGSTSLRLGYSHPMSYGRRPPSKRTVGFRRCRRPWVVREQGVEGMHFHNAECQTGDVDMAARIESGALQPAACQANLGNNETLPEVAGGLNLQLANGRVRLGRNYSAATTKYTKYTKGNRRPAGDRSQITFATFQSLFSDQSVAMPSCAVASLFVCFVYFVVLSSA